MFEAASFGRYSAWCGKMVWTLLSGCDAGVLVGNDSYSASDLVALGYVSERLTSIFGEPDFVDGEPHWDVKTVFTVERDVLAPAARLIFDAFAPEWNTRLSMQGANLSLGWPQMEQMLSRVMVRDS
uniref:hypothetical protein n=1 Tax=Rhodococcus qingshengii TaxID=334542 RepID=UPI002119EB0E|nr:hypothetical protein [Rhodococcus qingshengii]